ncbi:DHHC palmitoyltransferase-domain-containing protein [Spinellus fusiger]|nr:DHHC palmitoyltransferase-domain-containing protein [Spinellus fusiger]
MHTHRRPTNPDTSNSLKTPPDIPSGSWDTRHVGLSTAPTHAPQPTHTLLRVKDHRVPDSFENIGPHPQQNYLAASSPNDFPHCSDVTAMSNMTTDDSTTLISARPFPPYKQTSSSPSFPQINPKLTKPTKPTKPPKTTRNYQVFPGRNKFFCDGRLMTSREYWAFLIAFVLLVGPCVLFLIFTCPFLWYEVHPAVTILFVYLFVLCFAAMLKTSWTDPGIIPRDLDPSPEHDDDQGSTYGASLWSHNVPAQREVRIKDNTWALRYCDTCKLYRPPRASHCRQCDNCVENEDHHCIWLNNCIGKRNYRPFFTFIVTATLLCCYVIVFSVVHLLSIAKQQANGSFNTLFQVAPVSFVLCIVCFLLLWMVGGLTFYHCSLIMRGVTTHEQLRASLIHSRYPGLSANPFHMGSPSRNMLHVLCRPQPKSYLGRRKYVMPKQPSEPSSTEPSSTESSPQTSS